MNSKLAVKWIVSLVLGSVVWMALGPGHSPFDFVGMLAAAVCGLFIWDCVEAATGRPASMWVFVITASVLVFIMKRLVRVPETASVPVALIVAWKFDELVLAYQAARAIRKLKEKAGAEGVPHSD